MRAKADAAKASSAVEKAVRRIEISVQLKQRELWAALALVPYKRRLLTLAAAATDAHRRWHLALILPRLQLTKRERAALSEVLFEYLDDQSSLVKTFAMQGLADLSVKDAELWKTFRRLLAHLTEHGAAAMRARAESCSSGSQGSIPRSGTYAKSAANLFAEIIRVAL